MSFPLNALRAFEASARHLSFTRAGHELSVTQAAVAAQVKNLEGRLRVRLFRRLPRGLALTDEGQALLALVSEPFGRLEAVFEHFQDGKYREPLTVAAVGTFAVGWLMPRLKAFAQAHPFIDLRLTTHNNRIDQAAEGVDYAIRFGEGAWHGMHADALMQAPMSPLCAPEIARRVAAPEDLARETLLRSFRSDEWSRWFAAAGVRNAPAVQRGPMFDTSLALAAAAAGGAGVALLPITMFGQELREQRLVQPFDVEVSLGSYWLTRLQSKPPTAAMERFREWLMGECAPGSSAR
jgi:LysR family transcriptional regulator of beta-lactamase